VKSDGESLDTFDQGSSEQRNRDDQDAKEQHGEQDGRKAVSSAQQLLQPTVSRVTGNGDDQPPCHHSDKGFQNTKTGGSKQEDKADVNGDFDGPVQMRLFGRGSVSSHNTSSHSDRNCSLVESLFFVLPTPKKHKVAHELSFSRPLLRQVHPMR